MILLLEPPAPAGFVSGGYRYQARIFDRLAARGLGRRQAVRPDELLAAIDAERSRSAATRMVVDGLFLEMLDAALPAGVITLLHAVPTRSDWCREPAAVIATGAGTAAQVRSQCRAVAVVQPGLDACFVRDHHEAGAGATTRIVCVGTLHAGKAQLRLVRLLQTIAAPWQMTLLGNLSSHPDYVRDVVAAARGLAVDLRGAVSPEAVAHEYGRSDLLVSLSQSESFGMAVAEAAACALPVLALATGEIPNLVRPDVNGWLLPTDASDADVRALLADLLLHPARLATARRCAVRPALTDWDQVTDRFLAACDEVGSRR